MFEVGRGLRALPLLAGHGRYQGRELATLGDCLCEPAQLRIKPGDRGLELGARPDLGAVLDQQALELVFEEGLDHLGGEPLEVVEDLLGQLRVGH